MPDLLEKIKHPHHLRQQLGGVFFLCLVIFSKGMAGPLEKTWIVPGGAVLFFAGLIGRAWASGFLVKNDMLTTTGPYGRVRNPIYAANLLLGSAFVLLSGHYWTLIILVLLYTACYVPAMRVEEENLRRRYGSAFETYARSVPLIFPRVGVAESCGGDLWRPSAYFENKELPVTAGLVIGFSILLCRRLAGSG